MPRQDEREPVPYSREETALQSQELLPVIHDKSQERIFIKNIRKEDKQDRKDVVKISNKPILKQRLVHLYVCGYYTTRQIARILNVSESTVRKVLKEEEVQSMIRMYQTTENEVVNQALKALRLQAVETQKELLESDNDVVRANVAKDILDRTGHKGEDKKTVNVNVTYEERLKALTESVVIQDVPYVIDDEEEENKTEGAVNGDE